MASKASSGNILDLTKKYQSNKFEDKTLVVGDVEVVFVGFISSRRGAAFHQMLADNKAVEAIVSVMKTPDEAQAQALVDAIEDGVPYTERTEAMSDFIDFVMGRKAEDPNR